MKCKRITLAIAIASLLIPALCMALPADKTIPLTTTSKEALAQYTKGLEMADRQKFEEARDLFAKAAQIDSSFAMAHYSLANTATEYDAAIKELDKALALADKVSEGERLLIQALKANYDGSPNKGRELVQKAITLYPGDCRARMSLAVSYQNEQMYDKATAELQEVIRIDPQFAIAYNSMGYVFAQQGNYVEAEKALKTYTELLPTEANPYDSYAEVLMMQGKHDESITAYQKALSIDPKFTMSYTGLANNYMFKEMPVEARKQAQKQYDLATTDATRITALNTMMLSYIYEGKYDLAIEQMKKGHDLAIKGNDKLGAANCLYTMGTITLEMSTMDLTKGTYLKTATPEVGKIDETKSLWKKANELVQESNAPAQSKVKWMREWALWQDAEIALRTSDTVTAKTRIDTLTGIVDKETYPVMGLHSLRGRLAMTEKRYDEALKELNQSDLRNPRNLFWMMEVYKATGNVEKTEEMRRRIVKFKENSLSLAIVRRQLTS